MLPLQLELLVPTLVRRVAITLRQDGPGTDLRQRLNEVEARVGFQDATGAISTKYISKGKSLL